MKVISNYKTTLSASMTSSQNTVPVTSMETVDGHTIVATDFDSVAYLVIEPGSANMEIVKVTGVSGSSFTGAVRGLAFYGGTETAVSANQKAHQSGSTIIMTNAHYYYDKLMDLDSNETITGVKTFTAPYYPKIDTAATLPTDDGQFATKKYVDDTAIAGAPKATNTVYGISKLSTAAASATVPIVVGDNDTRVPTQDENDALAGTSGTPSSTNKYVTNDDTSATASNNKVVRYGAGGMLKASTTAASVAGDVIALDAGAKLPAVDGSQLTNVNVSVFGLTASDNLKYSADTERTTTSAYNPTIGELVKTIKIRGFSGTVRVKWDIKYTVGANLCRSAVYLNGTIVGTTHDNATSTYATQTQDVTLADHYYTNTIDLYYGYNSTSGTCVIRNFRVYYDKSAIADAVVTLD